MIALAELVLAVAWTFGPNGFLLAQPLVGAEGLPASWLQPMTTQARVVFHDREDWAMAFYVPPSNDGTAVPPGVAQGPGPRILLFAPYYLATHSLVSSAQMPVDVAEYYFHAVLEGRLDLEMRRRSSAYADLVDERAGELMSDVPPRFQRTAYLAAVSDFGAHVLSIANEIMRASRRQNAAGRDLCRLVEQPASLFGLWTRSFVSTAYPGHYLLPGDANPGDPPRWQQSREPLTRRDKEMLIRGILGSDWSGEVSHDFGWLCPPAVGSVGDGDAANADRSGDAGVPDVNHRSRQAVD